MTILIVFEIFKTIAWAYILTLIILKRKYIPVNKKWIGIISSALMVLAGIQDVYNYHSLEIKSILWFVASLFIIMFYVTVIRSCCINHSNLNKTMNEFIEKIERDKKELL